LKRKHQNITEDQAQIHINEHLRQPELLIKFSIDCPEHRCQSTLRSCRESDLKQILFNHIFKSKKHKHEKINYSKESLATYAKGNCKRLLVPAQEQLKSTKKRKINK